MKVGLSIVAAMLIAPLLELGGCASQPLARAGGPAQAQAISVALVGQRCDRENDPNWSIADMLGLDLRIRVTNSGATELRFDPAQTDTVHRIDQALARREVEAAGFVFEAESQVLRNPADNRTERVFDADIRGHTDQFVMRFRKPR